MQKPVMLYCKHDYFRSPNSQSFFFFFNLQIASRGRYYHIQCLSWSKRNSHLQLFLYNICFCLQLIKIIYYMWQVGEQIRRYKAGITFFLKYHSTEGRTFINSNTFGNGTSATEDQWKQSASWQWTNILLVTVLHQDPR